MKPLAVATTTDEGGLTMPYIENDKHCRECICPTCDLFQTKDCLENADACDKCDNTHHTGSCPWSPDEQEDMEFITPEEYDRDYGDNSDA